jgi:hypothetical protein
MVASCAHGQHIKLRLFVEGIELPCIGFTCQCLPNAPLMASIQIPPLPEAIKFLPRSVVHVFFRDLYESATPLVAEFFPPPTEKTAASPTAAEKREQRQKDSRQESGELVDEPERDTKNKEKDNTSYKVLFVGEMIGMEWTKTMAHRSMVLQCADLSNYWDYAFQWNNTGLFGPGIKALFAGGSTNLFTDFLSSKAEVITNVLKTPSIMYPKLKGLSGGIIHLLESIGGSYYYEKKIAGQNIFFTTAELRLHIMQTVIAVEEDTTAGRLVSVQGYSGLFSRWLGGMGGQTSIRKSITALSGIIFHEMYPQPCPKYEPGLEGTVSGVVRKHIAEDENTSFVVDTVRRVRTQVQEVGREILVTGDEPDVKRRLEDGKVGLRGVRSDLALRLRNQAKLLYSERTRASRAKIPYAPGLLSSAARKLGPIAARLQGRWRPGNEKETNRLVKDFEEIDSILDRIEKLQIPVTKKKERRPARLNQQIFRPDVWFSSPPRCNVLFPEQYDSVSFRRQFLQEPTRLLLKTNDEFFGEDALFDKHYFAPKTSSLQHSKTNLQKLLRSELMDHEILTGILPVFEKMGELNIFSVRGGISKDKVPQVGLAQRSANFLYFKYRFASRQMSISCRFNPYLAYGFPCLVIDRWADEERLNTHDTLVRMLGIPTRDAISTLGTNFLGNITQMTIQIDQQQGSNDIILSYPRVPDESVEFLGATDKEDVSVSQRFDEDVNRTTDVAAVAPPVTGQLGPNLGVISAVVDVTDQYNPYGENSPSSKPLLLWGGDSGDGPPRPADKRKRRSVVLNRAIKFKDIPKDVRKELGLEKGQVNEFSGERVSEVYSAPAAAQAVQAKKKNSLSGSGDTPLGAKSKLQPAYSLTKATRYTREIVIRAYRVTERVPRYRQEVVDLPAEEYIRPGWYGDIWHPANIGKAYNQFFGIGSITDPHVVSDPQGGKFTSTVNEMQDSISEMEGRWDGQDSRKDAALIYELRSGASIEQAAGFLTATYSHIKQKSLSAEQFIRAYTWRPIATMVDMFGTSNLILSPDGAEVLDGVEGFHSRAFGDFEDLFALVTPEIEEITGLKRGSEAAVKGDTRKRKREPVLAYVSALGPIIEFAGALLA